MRIPAHDRLIVLSRQSGDPEIVFGNGATLLAKLVSNLRVGIRGGCVDEENLRFTDESRQKRSEMESVTGAQ